MKPLNFVCYNRPKNNREAWLKCDRATRVRLNMYLMRVWVALADSDEQFADEDREFVAYLINKQTQGRDWSDNELMKFNFIWKSGKRNSLVFAITEARRGADSIGYVDIRKLNIEPTIRNCAAECGIEWDFNLGLEADDEQQQEAAQAQPQPDQIAKLIELVTALSAQVAAQQAELEALRAELNAEPVAAPQPEPQPEPQIVESEIRVEDTAVSRLRLIQGVVQRIKAKSAARSPLASQPEQPTARPALHAAAPPA